MTTSAPARPRTIPAMIDLACRISPQATAIIYRDRAITYAELGQRARCVATALSELGICAGDRVALWLPSAPAYLYLQIACARIGAIAVAVNTRYRASEVEDIVGRTRAKLLVYWPGFRGIDFNEILAGVSPDALGGLEAVIVYHEGEDTGPMPLADKRHLDYANLEAKPGYAGCVAAPETPVKIFTTSGTTHAPKFVLHSHAGLVDHAYDVAARFGLQRADCVGAIALPLGGVFGFNGTLAMLAARRPVVLMPVFEPGHFLEQLQRYRVTQWNGADEMVHQLLQSGVDDATLRRHTHVGYATFNVALSDIVARADARGLRLVSLWGMSELQALAAQRDPSASIEERSRMGGRLVSPSAKVRARDPETGRLLPKGEAGELEINGPSRMLGYFENPDATAQTLTEDGFVRTGDLGRVEADDQFEFLARMGDVMRLGGFLVSPVEIEEEIKRLPGIANVQVVAVPTAAGHRAVAFVIPEGGQNVDKAAIQSHCAGRLARYKIPALTIPIDEFPVTLSANGTKIQRGKLREMAAAAITQAPSIIPPAKS